MYKNIIDFKYMPPKGSGMAYAAAINRAMGKRSIGTQTRKVKRYPKKLTYGKTKKFGPRNDQVVTRTFNFIVKSDKADIFGQDNVFIGNYKNLNQSTTMLFNIADIPGVASYIGPLAPFTQYRVDYIEYHFVSCATSVLVDDTDQGTSASNIAKTQPMIYYSIVTGAERSGELTFATEDQCLMDNCKKIKCGTDFKVRFCPTSLTYSQSTREAGTGTAITQPVLRAERRKWFGDRFDYGSASIARGTNYYGLKVLVGKSSSDQGEWLYRVYAKLKVSFKGNSDNTNGNLSGQSYNHFVNYTNVGET
jgi:hypothetical protein